MKDSNQVNIYEIFGTLNFKYIIDVIESPILFSKISNKYIDLKECCLGRKIENSDNFNAKQIFLDNRTQLSKVSRQINAQNDMLIIFNLFKIFTSQKGYIDYFEEIDFLTPDIYFDAVFKEDNNHEFLCLKVNEQGKNLLYRYQDVFKQLFEMKSIPQDGIQI